MKMHHTDTWNPFRLSIVFMSLLAWALVFAACETITYVHVECAATIHLDSLTLEIDSVTFTPEEYATLCREEWENVTG